MMVNIEYRMGEMPCSSCELKSSETECADALMVANIDCAIKSYEKMNDIYMNSEECSDCDYTGHIDERLIRFNSCIGYLAIKEAARDSPEAGFV